jgi:8-hydroxy-5-deazaflavin:NADPH oxidoreductase
MNIAVIGAGRVGGTLGRRAREAGHQVTFGVRAPADGKYDALRAEGCAVSTVREAVDAADMVMLSTPWAAVPDALRAVGDFGGRVLVDATNPIVPGFVLAHGHTDSGAEQVARWAPSARVVKAFNSTGVENMAAPRYGEQRALMLVCGDDVEARQSVRGLAESIGFEAIDAGPLARARLIEPMAMLWITLAGPLDQGRDIAFGLLRR